MNYPSQPARLVRFDDDGDLVSDFGAGGIFTPQARACSTRAPELRDLFVSADDAIVVLAESCDGYLVGWLSSSGTLDVTFGQNGWISVDSTWQSRQTYWDDILRVDAQRRVVLHDGGLVVKRFLQDGTEDSTFTPVDIVGDGNAYNTHAFANPIDGSIVAMLPYGLVKFYTSDGLTDLDRPPFDNQVNALEWSGYDTVRFGPDGEMFAIGLSGLVLLSPLGEEIADLSYDDVYDPPFRGLTVVNGRLYRLDQYTNGRVAVSRSFLKLDTGRVYLDASPGHLFTPHPARVETADPVNTASGALVMSEVDVSAPAGSPMLAWGRSYDST